MRKILITNDDGIQSDGIARLAKAATKHGEVWVVAPDGQRSAMSHTVTLRDTVEAWEVDFPVEGVHAFACSGTPVDCVRVGTLNLVPGKPDIVLSGINYGYNVATDIQYSATAGAAFEATVQKLPAIAFSEDMSDMHETTDRYLDEILAELLEKPIEANKIWNVNFPGCPLTECKGVMHGTKVSRDEFYSDHYDETILPDGRKSFQVIGERHTKADDGTDLRAVLDGYVSVGTVTNLS